MPASRRAHAARVPGVWQVRDPAVAFMVIVPRIPPRLSSVRRPRSLSFSGADDLPWNRHHRQYLPDRQSPSQFITKKPGMASRLKFRNQT
jgi:hypothetical protein